MHNFSGGPWRRKLRKLLVTGARRGLIAAACKPRCIYYCDVDLSVSSSLGVRYDRPGLEAPDRRSNLGRTSHAQYRLYEKNRCSMTHAPSHTSLYADTNQCEPGMVIYPVRAGQERPVSTDPEPREEGPFVMKSFRASPRNGDHRADVKEETPPAAQCVLSR